MNVTNKFVNLFHSRLNIIDLNTGDQPMADHTGRYVIIYNGEIYNYIELKREYKKQGALFRTQSDTEVILEGFKLKGENVCNDLNGMFAFAIWDCYKQRLFIARDRLGKKPLYWMTLDRAFYFSSVLDSFSTVPNWNKQLSRLGIALYHVMGSFWDRYTVYEKVYSLPASCYAFVYPEDAQPRISKYWRFDFSNKYRRKINDLLEEYESILIDSIRIRLRSDVPLALSFSGGVDTGTIAAVCMKILNAPLKCFTIDYHTKEDPSEDVIIAERVAKNLGLEWNYINFDYRNNLLDDLEIAYRFYDQPCQQIPIAYIFYLYKTIKQHATVVLTGNGADELFTGYIGDQHVRQKDIILGIVRWLRPFLYYKRISPYLRLSLPEAFSESLVTQSRTFAGDKCTATQVENAIKYFTSEAIECGATTALDLKMFYNLTCSTSDVNYRISDISGLSNQVEIRSPYLDYRLVEFAARLPHHYKIGNLFNARFNKYLPKLYYANHVPKDIAWGPKKGMAWNMKYGNNLARDSRYMASFERAFDTVDQAGFNTKPARMAMRNRIAADLSGGKYSQLDLKIMNNVFMLGKWMMENKGV